MQSTVRSLMTPIAAGLIAISAISYSAIGQVGVGSPTPIDDGQCTAAGRCRKCLGGCGPITGTIKIRCSATQTACCCAATGTIPTAGLCGCHSASYCQDPPSGIQCQ